MVTVMTQRRPLHLWSNQTTPSRVMWGLRWFSIQAQEKSPVREQLLHDTSIETPARKHPVFQLLLKKKAAGGECSLCNSLLFNSIKHTLQERL